VATLGLVPLRLAQRGTQDRKEEYWVKKAKFSTIEPRRSSPGDRVSHSKDLAGLVEDFGVGGIGLVQGERDPSFPDGGAGAQGRRWRRKLGYTNLLILPWVAVVFTSGTILLIKDSD
jgi:hypothetical protein